MQLVFELLVANVFRYVQLPGRVELEDDLEHFRRPFKVEFVGRLKLAVFTLCLDERPAYDHRIHIYTRT